MDENIIQNTIDFVKQSLDGAEGGHDWWHMERVWKLSKFIARTEDVDILIVELGALLHDIADPKFHEGDESVGPAKAVDFLKAQGVKNEMVDHIEQIIRNISFKGGNHQQEFRSPELDVIQDADRLDAIGAIGIARTFIYGGFKNRAIFDPAIPPQLSMSKEEYRKSESPTINHFYEKLLLLKDRMNTKTGRQLAEKRHQFMLDFLDEFYREWEGSV